MNRVGRSGSCNAKICDLYLSLVGDHDILRLDVPMHDIVVMRRLNAACHLNGNADRFLEVQLSFFLNIRL